MLLLSLKRYWRGPALIEMGSYESRLNAVIAPAEPLSLSVAAASIMIMDVLLQSEPRLNRSLQLFYFQL